MKHFVWISPEGRTGNQASHKSDTTHSSLSNFLSFKQQKSPHLPQTVPVFFFYRFFILFFQQFYFHLLKLIGKIIPVFG